MAKSAQAFRTIREVADWLDVAAHVLRFWESKFNQIKPVKRAGGRRYYRPADMELVGGIKVLLHDRGLTIRGVQKMIADEGLEAVTSLSPPVDELIGDDEVIDLEATDDWADDTASETSDADDDLTPDDLSGMEEPDLDDGSTEDAIEQHPEEAEPSVLALFSQEDDEDAPSLDEAPTHTASDDEAAEAPVEAAPASPIPRPNANPAEGPLGVLAAFAQLPAPQRAVLHPQIAALAQLRDRMAKPLSLR